MNPASKKILIILIFMLLLALIAGYWTIKKGELSEVREEKSGVVETSETSRSYFNDEYAFGFSLPEGHAVVESLPDDESESFLVTNKSGNNVQINVRILGEVARLQIKDIEESNPDLDIKNIKEEKIAGLNAFAFRATAGDVTTNEFWFIREETFFQLSALDDSTPIMDQIVESWVFEKM